MEKGSKKVERAEKSKNGIDKAWGRWYNEQADLEGSWYHRREEELRKDFLKKGMKKVEKGIDKLKLM